MNCCINFVPSYFDNIFYSDKQNYTDFWDSVSIIQFLIGDHGRSVLVAISARLEDNVK